MKTPEMVLRGEARTRYLLARDPEASEVEKAWKELGGDLGLKVTTEQIDKVLVTTHDFALRKVNFGERSRWYKTRERLGKALSFQDQDEYTITAIYWFLEERDKARKVLEDPQTWLAFSRGQRVFEAEDIRTVVKRYVASNAAAMHLREMIEARHWEM